MIPSTFGPFWIQLFFMNAWYIELRILLARILQREGAGILMFK
jgi:hypothetical protein